jgi:hypothetical protein
MEQNMKELRSLWQINIKSDTYLSLEYIMNTVRKSLLSFKSSLTSLFFVCAFHSVIVAAQENNQAEQKMVELACINLKAIAEIPSTRLSVSTLATHFASLSCDDGGTLPGDVLRTCIDEAGGAIADCTWVNSEPYKSNVEAWLALPNRLIGRSKALDNSIEAMEAAYINCLWTAAQYGPDHWSLGWEQSGCVAEHRESPPEYTVFESRAGGSTTFVKRRVDRMYRKIAHRAPDKEGWNYWTSFNCTVGDQRDMVYSLGLGLIQEIGFKAAIYKGISDDNAWKNIGITLLYRGLFNREPTGSELRYWRSQVHSSDDFGHIVHAAVQPGGEIDVATKRHCFI